MLRLTPLRLTLAGAFGILAAASAPARVLTLSYQTDTTAVVRDASDGDTATSLLTSPQGRLLVGTGLVAADAVHDLLYVVANADPLGPVPGTPATILVYGYGSSPVPSGSFDAPIGRYFTAFAFDATVARLVGIVADSSNLNTAVAQVFTVPTSNGTSIGTPNYVDTLAGCCRFAAGIAAWRASTQELFMVGRRDGDSVDQLLRFDLGAASPGPDAYPIVGDSVAALAVDNQSGSLYALAHSALSFTHLALVSYSTPDTPANLSAIGSAPAECCFVASGPAAIDGSGALRALHALTRDATTPASTRLSRFNLGDGSVMVVNNAIDGYGLWTDSAAMLDRIFTNGFD